MRHTEYISFAMQIAFVVFCIQWIIYGLITANLYLVVRNLIFIR